jgi:hypothetical protein
VHHASLGLGGHTSCSRGLLRQSSQSDLRRHAKFPIVTFWQLARRHALHVVRVEDIWPDPVALSSAYAQSPAIPFFLLQSLAFLFLCFSLVCFGLLLGTEHTGRISTILDHALYICQCALLYDAVTWPWFKRQVVERFQPVLRLLGHSL